MKSVWFGGDSQYPANSAVNYRQVNTGMGGSWAATETVAQAPISENVTITGLYVWLDTPPGAAASGTSFNFKVRDNSADTAASVTILETATTGSWTGSVAISKDHLVNVIATPTNTPATGANNWWYITYETATSSFVSLGGSYTPPVTNATTYIVLGSTNANTDTSAFIYDFPWPMNATLTALSVATPSGSPSAGKSYAVSIRNTTSATDLLTATISGTATAAQATGSVAITAGDNLVIKIAPGSLPTARAIKVGASFTPGVDGETAFGYASVSAPSTTVTNYDQVLADGGAWSGSESARGVNSLPPFVIRSLYFKLVAAPGTSKSRQLIVRDNGADTALTATISGASNSATDLTHSFTAAGGTALSSLKIVPTSTPAASAGVKVGYVVYIAPSTPTVNSGFFMFSRKQ